MRSRAANVARPECRRGVAAARRWPPRRLAARPREPERSRRPAVRWRTDQREEPPIPKARCRARVSPPQTRDWDRSSRRDERLAFGSRAEVASHVREVGRWHDRTAERNLDLLDRHVVEQGSGALADHAVRDVEGLGCGAMPKGGKQILTAEKTRDIDLRAKIDVLDRDRVQHRARVRVEAV